MFRWLADVLDGCALPVAAERWRRVSAHGAAWRAAVQGFWFVRWASICRAWVAAYLGRHSLQARACRWGWSLGVLGYLWYDMERLLSDPGVGWVPPVIGPFTLYVGAVGWVAFTSRVGGAVLLRPVKAAALVAVTFLPVWAGLSVVFHYGWGVAIWSAALWRDVVVPGWYRGVNFQWSAFCVWMAFELGWVVLLGFVWTRAPRAWLAVRKWGVRVFIWAVRYFLFVGIFWVGSSLLGRVPEQILVELARGVHEAVGGSEVVVPPGWAYLLLGGLIAAVLIGIGAVVLDAIGEVLSVAAKLLSVAMDGGVLRRGEGEVRHVTGFREYARRLDEKASRSVMGYVAKRVEAAAFLGITAAGFQRPHEDEPEPEKPAAEPAAAQGGTPAPAALEPAPAAAATDDGDGFDDDDEDAEGDGVSAPVDVPGRDDDLAVDRHAGRGRAGARAAVSVDGWPRALGAVPSPPRGWRAATRRARGTPRARFAPVAARRLRWRSRRPGPAARARGQHSPWRLRTAGAERWTLA